MINRYMKRLCDYGCGNEGKYLLKNGKYCCCENCNKCPSNRKKNSDKHKQKEYKECPYCHKMIVCNIGGQYNQHIKSCSEKYCKKEYLKTKDVTKYIVWYNKIIQYRQNNPLINGYRERHHIIPRSLGGDNSKSNLIYLTAREHFICHLLLVEIYRKDKESYIKMLSAFMMMKSRGENTNSRIYEKYRKEFSRAKQGFGLGELNNNYGNIWMSNPKTKESKLINKEIIDDYLQNGWLKGRIQNWDNYYAKLNHICLNQEYYKQKKNGVGIEEIIKNKKEREKGLEKHKIEMIELYTKYYNEYKINGYKGVVEKFGYNKSKANLVMQFHRYVVDYKPK